MKSLTSGYLNRISNLWKAYSTNLWLLGRDFVKNTTQVWNLYIKTKEMGVTPSEYLRVEEYVNQNFGLDGWWTCMQVDDAILSVGRHIENATTGFDSNNKPLPSVKDFFRRLKAKQAGNAIHTAPVTKLKRGSIGGQAPKLQKVS
jgi:hypothetical protein